MSRMTIEEAIKERIMFDELNNDIDIIPKWLDEATIPHYNEYKKCFLDGVNCKRYTDLKIVTDVLHDLEEQGRLAEVIRCKDCIRYGDEHIGAGWCDEHEHLTNDDDYCSYAVAKLAEMECAE